MKVLVTGRDGQLGSELQDLAQQSEHKFTFVGSKDGDITNKSLLRDLIVLNEIDAIINCAAYTAVDKAETEKELAFKINGEGVQNLVDLSLEFDLKLIHISTDYVFPGNGHTPYKVDDPVAPLGVYGASKLAGEEAIIKSAITALIIRTSWVFSSYGNNFVKTMARLGKERESLNVVNDQKGCPTYARDLAHVCLTLLDKEWNHKRIYHFSNSVPTTWYEFAKEIMRLTNSNCTVNPIPSSDFPTPAERPLYSVMDITDLEKDFGVKPRNWKEALEDCIALI